MLRKHSSSIVRILENVRITVRDLEGNILEQVVLKNTITNLLFNLYRDALAGDLTHKDDLKIHYLAIGDDDGTILPLAVTNTTLGNELFRIPIVDDDATVLAQYWTQYYLAPSEAVGWIREVGWFAGEAADPWGGGAGKDSGTLIARLFYLHDKTTLESIQFERTDKIKEKVA